MYTYIHIQIHIHIIYIYAHNVYNFIYICIYILSCFYQRVIEKKCFSGVILSQNMNIRQNNIKYWNIGSWGCHHYKTDRSPPTIKIPQKSLQLLWRLRRWLPPPNHQNPTKKFAAAVAAAAVAATTPVQRRAGAIGMFEGGIWGLAGAC